MAWLFVPLAVVRRHLPSTRAHVDWAHFTCVSLRHGPKLAGGMLELVAGCLFPCIRHGRHYLDIPRSHRGR